MYLEKEIFSRNELLIGREAMDKLKQTRVILFGVGGVGSWCAESLIRSGIGHLTIVDFDNVSISNINRQLPATTETVDQAKIDVLKKRLLAINPHAEITAIRNIYSAETAATFELNSFDYIIDAIDSLQHKAHLILTASQTNATFFSSMGAALKLNPARIRTTEFWKVQGCPLAAALRRRFKKQNTFPAKKFQCVYSDEVIKSKRTSTSDRDTQKTQPNGTIAHITAIFGFTLAAMVTQKIIEQYLHA